KLANAFAEKIAQQELERLRAAAAAADSAKLQVNAGHGINYRNMALIHKIPHLVELNIGHSIVARSVFVGFETAVREMLASMERFGERFLHRVFTAGEIEYSQSMKFPARHLAARFAAKEAISKAFGTGIGKAMGWKDIDVHRKPSGEPFVVLEGGAKKLAEE